MLDRILEWLTAPLPRFVRLVVLPATGLLLVTVFVFLGFPYEVLADRALAVVEAQTGAIIRYAEVEPRLTVGGPGFRLHQVDVRLSDGTRYSADPVSVRPAWSTGWLTGNPMLRAFVVSEHGSLAGFVTVGRSYAWDGRIIDLDLSAIPLRGLGDVEISGRADVEANIRYADGAAEGEIELAARSGDIVYPAMPMPIEFETVNGSVSLGGDHLARVDSLTLDGPLFGASVRGTVGHARGRGSERIDATIGIDVREPGMRSLIKGFGLVLDSEGHADLSLGGTLSKPQLR